jgi:hypothetical protein
MNIYFILVLPVLDLLSLCKPCPLSHKKGGVHNILHVPREEVPVTWLYDKEKINKTFLL